MSSKKKSRGRASLVRRNYRKAQAGSRRSTPATSEKNIAETSVDGTHSVLDHSDEENTPDAKENPVLSEKDTIGEEDSISVSQEADTPESGATESSLDEIMSRLESDFSCNRKTVGYSDGDEDLLKKAEESEDDKPENKTSAKGIDEEGPDDADRNDSDNTDDIYAEKEEQPSDENEDSLGKLDLIKNLDDYLAEDLELLEGEDYVILEDQALGLLRQSEGVVTWSVSGLYKDNGDLRSRIALKSDPPVLTIKDSQSGEAKFVLTEALVDQLGSVMNDARRGFNGVVSGKRRSLVDEVKTEKDRIVDWVINNKIKTTASVMILVYFFIVLTF